MKGLVLPMLPLRCMSLAGLMGLSSFPVRSQETVELRGDATPASINADRPTQGFNAFVLPKGMWQFETGFTSENQNDIFRLTTVNLTELRFGLTDRIELNVAQGYNGTKSELPGEDVTLSGFTGITLGLRSNIFEAQGAIPQVTFLGRVTLPTGEDPFQPAQPIPSFVFAFHNALGKYFSLDYNVGMAWNDIDPTSDFLYTLAFSYSPFKIPISVFLEPYGFIDEGPADHRINFGMMYLIKSNWQVDASAGFGLSEESPRNFVAIGTSFLFYQ